MADPKYQYIKLPDGSYGKFDENATDEEIRGHIQKDFPDAFKSPPPPGPVSRFAKSAADSSGLSTIGSALRHPFDTAGNVIEALNPDTSKEDFDKNPIVTGVRGAVGNTVDNTKQAWSDARSGNAAGAVSHAVSAIPVLGPTLDKATDQYADKDYAGEAGTLTGAAASIAAGKAAAEYAPRVPGAVKQGVSRFRQSAYPTNLALTPEETAAQGFVKALKPDANGVERIKGAASEVPTVRDYAQRTNTPINGKLDFAKAAEGAAQEVQGHYDTNLLRPHSGKFQTVPDDYNGEYSGNGQNQATLKQINDRVNSINQELSSNFRKKLKSQTGEAQASDAELNAEKGKLTTILHQKLADMNGLQPEDIAGVRQRAGKLRALAEEAKLSGNNDTLSAGRHEVGSAFSPVKNALDAVTDTAIGGPEVVGNRVFKGALEDFPVKNTPLPQPVLPDPATTPTTPEAAQQEFLRSHALEQGAQDASADRGATADTARQVNADADQQQTMAEGAALRETGRQRVAALQNPPQPTIQDQQVVAPDPSRGVQPVTLPVEVPPPAPITTAPAPDTHAFSKAAWLQQNPSGDVNAAVDMAKQAGYDVQD